MQFYIDDVCHWNASLLNSFNNPSSQSFPYTEVGQPFDQPFYIILNLAIGGDFFGSDGQSLTLAEADNWSRPSLQVDYIRVYQRNETSHLLPQPVTSNASSCLSIYSDLICRTTSANESYLNSFNLDDTLGYLCQNYPDYCTDILNGKYYSSCDKAIRTSMAMNQYYRDFGPDNNTCYFSGLGQLNGTTVVYVPSTTIADTQQCSDMWNSLKCRTVSEDVTTVGIDSINSAR